MFRMSEKSSIFTKVSFFNAQSTLESPILPAEKNLCKAGLFWWIDFWALIFGQMDGFDKFCLGLETWCPTIELEHLKNLFFVNECN